MNYIWTKMFIWTKAVHMNYIWTKMYIWATYELRCSYELKMFIWTTYKLRLHMNYIWTKMFIWTKDVYMNYMWTKIFIWTSYELRCAYELHCKKNWEKFLLYYERCTDILSYKWDQSSVDFSLFYKRFIFPIKINLSW